MIPVNITKEIKTLTIGNRTITLKPNETNEEAIVRLQNSSSNGGGNKIAVGEESEGIKSQEKE